MLCSSSLRTVIIQAGCIGSFSRQNLGLGTVRRVLHDNKGPLYPWNCELRRFRAGVTMMIDISAMDNRGSVVDVTPGKEGGVGYVSGGCKSEDGKLSCGYSSFRGKRASMEDYFDVKMSKLNGKTVCLFGIFDGHGGSRAAEYLKQHLFDNLMKHPLFLEDTKVAISETYKQTDKEFLDAEKDTFRDDGSTASTAVLVGNHLYVANVGDSRTIISKAGKAIPLSEDHKPNRLDERKRIENAGGVVMWAGTWRVGGVLAMSRAFGNRMLKQFVVAEPEIQEQDINEDLELLVLASDGLWDVVPNEDAISIAKAEGEADAAAGKLTETAFTRGSADNITCIVVKFHHGEAGGPQLESQKEPEIRQAQSEVPKLQQDQSNVSEVKQDHDNVPEVKQDHGNVPEVKQDHGNVPEVQSDQTNEVDLQHNQMKEADQQDQHKAQAGLEQVKEAEVQQDQSKEAQPRQV